MIITWFLRFVFRIMIDINLGFIIEYQFYNGLKNTRLIWWFFFFSRSRCSEARLWFSLFCCSSMGCFPADWTWGSCCHVLHSILRGFHQHHWGFRSNFHHWSDWQSGERSGGSHKFRGVWVYSADSVSLKTHRTFRSSWLYTCRTSRFHGRSFWTFYFFNHFDCRSCSRRRPELRWMGTSSLWSLLSRWFLSSMSSLTWLVRTTLAR